MVWGSMTAQGAGKLLLIDGNMMTDQHITLLCKGVIPSFRKYRIPPQHRVFQQDNAPQHTSKRTKSFISSQNYTLPNWPPQSPDLNPIEHLWPCLKEALKKTHPTSANNADLWANLQETWSQISSDLCRYLVGNMRNCCAAVIAAGGGHTWYSRAGYLAWAGPCNNATLHSRHLYLHLATFDRSHICHQICNLVLYLIPGLRDVVGSPSPTQSAHRFHTTFCRQLYVICVESKM